MKALIVGNGNVGKALSQVLSTEGCEHYFFNGRTVNAEFIRQAKWADVIFITISTKGKGLEALSYILCCVEIGKIVITAEKAAIAHHWNIVRPYLNRNIGFTTTVGGASNPLSLFEKIHSSEIGSILGVVNGTMNFLSWFIQTGKGNINDALYAAQAKGLLDSRSSRLNKIIDDEISDALKKAVILFNSSRLGPVITPDHFSYWLLCEDEYLRLLGLKPHTRFVVSIEQADKRVMPQNGFDFYVRPWHIQGRFVDGANEFMHGLIPDEENNCVIVNHSLNGGWESKSGIGAGSSATARALFEEARCFLTRP